MIFQCPELPGNYLQVVENVDDLRKRLRLVTSDSLHRWRGFLARMSYARVIHGSNTMEGINATLDDAVAAVDHDPPADPSNENWQALIGHRDAMDYIIQLSREPTFTYNEGTLLGLHFMMMKYDLSRNPGRYRPGAIHVTNTQTGRVVYEGPDVDLLPKLMPELIDSLNQPNKNHVIVRAAMAHLNLTLIHPFKDGNGRMARALQTFVLAREGILDPRFSSIEEYVGRNFLAYYDVLTEVAQGSWHPENDSLPWIKFCLRAHYFQAQTLIRRVQETGALWSRLEDETRNRKLPERTISALMNAATGRKVRNFVYRKEQDISAQVAKKDLKQLVDHGFLIPKGERRGRTYEGSPLLKELWRACRVDKPIDDPFGEKLPPKPMPRQMVLPV